MAIDVNNPGTVAQEPKQTQSARDDREINFEKLRKKTEALESALQERDQMLRQQQSALEQMQSRFAPVDRDEIDALPDEELIDKAKFKRLIDKERSSMRKEAEEIARQTYKKIDSENFQQKLYSQYPDYDQVVNASNAEKLQERDPLFVKALANVSDDYARRDMAYQRMKSIIQADEKPKVKAQDVVNENRQAGGNFYSPGGQGPMANPNSFEFDVRSKEARTKAYERLKAAQKRG